MLDDDVDDDGDGDDGPSGFEVRHDNEIGEEGAAELASEVA